MAETLFFIRSHRDVADTAVATGRAGAVSALLIAAVESRMGRNTCECS
jgi:hypothetical protein